MRVAFSVCVSLVVSIAFGCAAPTATPGPTTSGGAAAATAGAAAAVWAAGKGCRLQGCPYGSYCNEESGFCEARSCSEGCPENTVCNEGLDRCQAAPPPDTPNDFLPQDDKINNPPGAN